MIYRFNRLFNVSKTRAFIVAVLCFIAGVCVIPLGIALTSDPAGGLASIYPFAVSLIYGCIWFYKVHRDQRLARQSQAVHQPSVQVMPEMTTPGSKRLFVPQPLDRPE